MTRSRSRFKRQESWRLKRVKDNWRRPRGVTSRMRKEKNGWPELVKAGHGSKAARRWRHPRGLVERLVRSESDLKGVDPKQHIVRLSGRLGERKRSALLERIKSLNVHIANPGREETRPVGEQAEAEVRTLHAEPTRVETTVEAHEDELESSGKGNVETPNESEAPRGARSQEDSEQ